MFIHCVCKHCRSRTSPELLVAYFSIFLTPSSLFSISYLSLPTTHFWFIAYFTLLTPHSSHFTFFTFQYSLLLTSHLLSTAHSAFPTFSVTRNGTHPTQQFSWDALLHPRHDSQIALEVKDVLLHISPDIGILFESWTSLQFRIGFSVCYSYS